MYSIYSICSYSQASWTRKDVERDFPTFFGNLLDGWIIAGYSLWHLMWVECCLALVPVNTSSEEIYIFWKKNY